MHKWDLHSGDTTDGNTFTFHKVPTWTQRHSTSMLFIQIFVSKSFSKFARDMLSTTCWIFATPPEQLQRWFFRQEFAKMMIEFLPLTRAQQKLWGGGGDDMYSIQRDHRKCTCRWFISRYFWAIEGWIFGVPLDRISSNRIHSLRMAWPVVPIFRYLNVTVTTNAWLVRTTLSNYLIRQWNKESVSPASFRQEAIAFD